MSGIELVLLSVSPSPMELCCQAVRVSAGGPWCSLTRRVVPRWVVRKRRVIWVGRIKVRRSKKKIKIEGLPPSVVTADARSWSRCCFSWIPFRGRRFSQSPFRRHLFADAYA